MNGSLKENDSDDDGQKPSFGTSLDHLKARPSQPSQSRQSRRLKSKRSSSEANNDISIKLEEVEQACLRRNSHQGDEESTPARVTSSSVAALSKVKAENGRDHVEYPRDRSPTLSKVGNTPKSNKKRKVYDEKQFEGMKGIPDRIDYDLDGESDEIDSQAELSVPRAILIPPSWYLCTSPLLWHQSGRSVFRRRLPLCTPVKSVLSDLA